MFYFTVVRFREFLKKQCIKGQRENNGQWMSQKKLWEPTVHCGIKQTKEELVIIKYFITAEPETQELVGTKMELKGSKNSNLPPNKWWHCCIKYRVILPDLLDFPGDSSFSFPSCLSFLLPNFLHILLEMFTPLPPISAIVQHVVCSTVESCPPQRVKEGQRYEKTYSSWMSCFLWKVLKERERHFVKSAKSMFLSISVFSWDLNIKLLLLQCHYLVILIFNFKL